MQMKFWVIWSFLNNQRFQILPPSEFQTHQKVKLKVSSISDAHYHQKGANQGSATDYEVVLDFKEHEYEKGEYQDDRDVFGVLVREKCNSCF